MADMSSPLARHVSLSLLAVGYLVVGALWAVAVPAFEKPDEMNHFAYVRFLERELRLPVQAKDTGDFVEPEAHQPPLFYAAGAVIGRLTHAVGVPATSIEPWRERVNPRYTGDPSRLDAATFWLHGRLTGVPDPPPAHDVLILRALSLVIGLATIVVTYRIGMIVLGGRHWLALGAGALVGFLPQFTFSSTSVSNDPLSWFVAGTYVLLLMRLVDAPRHRLRRDYVLLGVVMGAALLTKMTLVCLVPLVFLVRPRSATRREWVSGLLAWSIACSAVCGWWFLRNFMLYGDALGRQELINPDLYRWNLDAKSLSSPYFRGDFWRRSAQSSIGTFGFMHITLPRVVYIYVILVAIAAVFGLLLHVVRRTVDRDLRQDGAGNLRLLVLGSLPIFALAALIHYNLTVTQPQGRYLFPALPGVAVLGVLGLDELFDRVGTLWGGQRRRVNGRRGGGEVLGCLLIAAIVVLNLYALFVVVAPTYGPLAWWWW